MTNRQTILTVFLIWSLMALSPIGADWLTSIGVGEWTAVWVVAAAPFVVALIGLPYWRRTGKRTATRQLLLVWVGAPGIVLGLTGLITGSASRGHVFVLVFLAIPAAIALVVIALGGRRADG
ncbi:hypothetical protein Amsp01_001540 [Amycolatopsis sp. NBRC 101858]|uniref:hypothetical protein n=1 Tax=Amycolatopsis sp. NBRC 101858 TaxID=3032200 RepID=UPI0024A0435A|nr:hypothetical protein [Amycolatopsis sp. NBRC 101858]GLY34130.1 hypothetical protein Amsp01_001540 [Amycolatopsis sp. NBRC 101858]